PFAWPADAKYVHSAIQRVLTERISPLGAKLHTARSRNDQIALDLRLFVIELLGDLDRAVKDLALALVERAGDEVDTVMPGYTHLQRAQPVSLAHHLLAHVEALRRDRARIEEAHERAAVSPLGARPGRGRAPPRAPGPDHRRPRRCAHVAQGPAARVRRRPARAAHPALRRRVSRTRALDARACGPWLALRSRRDAARDRARHAH